MNLIQDAAILFPKLWSVRLSIIAGLISAAQAGWEVYSDGKTSAVAIAAALVAFSAAMARIVAQPKLVEEVAEAKAAQ